MVLKNSYVSVIASNHILDLISNSNLADNYVPTITSNLVTTSIPIAELKVIKTSENYFNRNKELEWEYGYYKNPSVWDIISLIEYISEYIRQKYLGIYCLNGSACQINDTTIVTWGGASSMGKTGLCYEMRSLGAKFIYDEKVLISAEGVAGGLPVLYLHKDFYSKGKKQAYERLRSVVNPENNMKLICIYPHLLSDKLSSGADIVEMDQKRALWLFSDSVNKRLRGVTRMLFDNTMLADSLDTTDLSEARIKSITSLMQKSKQYEVFGNYTDCAKRICGELL